MAINRFDRPGQYDFNMEHYVPQQFMPNFEAWDNLLGTFQKEHDQTRMLAERAPDYIKPDEAAAQEYITNMRGQVDSLTDKYSTGNINAARGDQSKLMRQIYRDWSPGGTAHNLMRRKQEYGAIIKDYKEKFKDAPGFMMDYAQQATAAGINPGALSESIGDPNVSAYFDVAENLHKLLNGFEADKDTIIRGTGPNSPYIWKETGVKVTAEELSRAANQIMNQPKFRDQLAIESWDANRRYQKEELTDRYMQGIDNELNQTINAIDNMPTKDFQKIAIHEGMNIGSSRPDGIEGDMTKAAREQYKNTLLDKAQKAKENFNPTSYINNMVRNNYIEPMVRKFEKSERSLDVKENPYFFQNIRFSQSQRLMDYNKKVPVATSISFKGPASPINPEDLRGKKETALNQLSEVRRGFQAHINNAQMTGVITPDNAASLIEAYENSYNPETGMRDKKVFTESVNNPYAGQIFDYFNASGNEGSLNKYVTQLSDIESEINEYNNTMASGLTSYLSSPDGAKDVDLVYEQNANKLKTHGINSKDEFVEAIKDNKFEYSAASNQFKIGIPGSPNPSSIIDMTPSNKIIRNSDSWLRDNPNGYRSAAPQGLVGANNTIVDEQNKLLFDVVDQVGLSAFSGHNGIKGGQSLMFTSYGDKDLQFDPGLVKPTAVTPVIRNGQNVLLIKGEADTENGKVETFAYAVPHSAVAKQQIADSGLAVYSYAHSITGDLLNTSSSVNERKQGANQYFAGSHGHKYNLARMSQIVPNSDYTMNINDPIGIDINKNQVAGNPMHKLGKVTPVGRPIPIDYSDGMSAQIVTKFNSGGEQVWFATFRDPNKKVYVGLNAGHNVMSFSSAQSALDYVAVAAADYAADVKGTYKQYSKTNREYSANEMEGRLNIAQQNLQ